MASHKNELVLHIFGNVLCGIFQRNRPHTRGMDNITEKPQTISPHIHHNMQLMKDLFADSQDFIGRHMPAGGQHAPWVYMAYIDMMSDRGLMDMTVIRRLFDMDWNALSEEEKGAGLYATLRDRGLATTDLSEADNMDDVLYFIMAGDTAVFVDGYPKAIIIATRGFPNRGIQSAETEIEVQGPREAFSEVMRFNTALVRRRIRDRKFPTVLIRMLLKSRRLTFL